MTQIFANVICLLLVQLVTRSITWLHAPPKVACELPGCTKRQSGTESLV